MTTTVSATRAENRWLIGEMTQTVGPSDLSDDEAAAMVDILKAALDRNQESIRARVVYLHSERRARR